MAAFLEGDMLTGGWSARGRRLVRSLLKEEILRRFASAEVRLVLGFSRLSAAKLSPWHYPSSSLNAYLLPRHHCPIFTDDKFLISFLIGFSEQSLSLSCLWYSVPFSYSWQATEEVLAYRPFHAMLLLQIIMRLMALRFVQHMPTP